MTIFKFVIWIWLPSDACHISFQRERERVAAIRITHFVDDDDGNDENPTNWLHWTLCARTNWNVKPNLQIIQYIQMVFVVFFFLSIARWLNFIFIFNLISPSIARSLSRHPISIRCGARSVLCMSIHLEHNVCYIKTHQKDGARAPACGYVSGGTYDDVPWADQTCAICIRL